MGKEEKNTEKNYLEDLKRVQAEFENYRKREETLNKERIKLSNQDLISNLIPVLDNFELALNNTEDSNAKKGMEMIYSQLYSILEGYGLKKMQTKGKFNPELQEAMLVEHSDKEKDEILEVLQEGYYIHEKVLRHAKVKLSGGKK